MGRKRRRRLRAPHAGNQGCRRPGVRSACRQSRRRWRAPARSLTRVGRLRGSCSLRTCIQTGAPCPGCAFRARCPRLYTSSHTPSSSQAANAGEAPSGTRGRALAASRLPACTARAGATASLSPSMRRAQAPTALAPRGPSVQPKKSAARSGLPCTQHMVSACGAQSQRSARLLAVLRSQHVRKSPLLCSIARTQHTTAPGRCAQTRSTSRCQK